MGRNTWTYLKRPKKSTSEDESQFFSKQTPLPGQAEPAHFSTIYMAIKSAWKSIKILVSTHLTIHVRTAATLTKSLLLNLASVENTPSVDNTWPHTTRVNSNVYPARQEERE